MTAAALTAGRLALLEAQAQALNVLLVYAEASDPRAIRAIGALCAAAAFNTPNQAAAAVLRTASRRLMAAAVAERA